MQATMQYTGAAESNKDFDSYWGHEVLNKLKHYNDKIVRYF